MHDMTSAQPVGMFVAITTIAIVAFVFLVLFVATAPVRQAAAVIPWAPGELGAAATFREPADLAEVDRRAELFRGRATVIHSPARIDIARPPVDEPAPVFHVPAPLPPWRGMSMAELVESTRYVLPNAIAVKAPAGPAAHVESVGRHRAPVLVAA